MFDVGLADSSLQHADAANPFDPERGERGLYRDHIVAARFFVQRAHEAEDSALRAGDRRRSTAPLVRHRSYVSAALLSAAAFLEASINELYLQLHGARGRERGRLPRGMTGVLARFWTHVEHEPVMNRYQLVLTASDAERFDERREPFCSADNLIKLRDLLIYARPERADRRRRQRALEHSLRGLFEANPLAASDAAWFPHLCLGSGCAAWAVQSAEVFSQEFCRRMSLPSRGLQRIETPTRPGQHTAGTTPNAGSSRHAVNGASPDRSR